MFLGRWPCWGSSSCRDLSSTIRALRSNPISLSKRISFGVFEGFIPSIWSRSPPPTYALVVAEQTVAINGVICSVLCSCCKTTITAFGLDRIRNAPTWSLSFEWFFYMAYYPIALCLKSKEILPKIYRRRHRGRWACDSCLASEPSLSLRDLFSNLVERSGARSRIRSPGRNKLESPVWPGFIGRRHGWGLVHSLHGKTRDRARSRSISFLALSFDSSLLDSFYCYVSSPSQAKRPSVLSAGSLH